MQEGILLYHLPQHTLMAPEILKCSTPPPAVVSTRDQEAPASPVGPLPGR